MEPASIAHTTLLKNFSPVQLNAVAKFLIDKKYRSQDILFAKGTLRDKVIIIKNGSASITSHLNPEQTVAIFKNSDCLGELALLPPKSRHQYDTVVTSQWLDAWELSSHNWQTIIKTRPDLAMKIYQNIALIIQERLDHANNKLAALFSAGQVIGQAYSINALALKILRIILEIIPSRKSAWTIWEPLTSKLYIAKSFGYKNFAENTYYKIKSDPLLTDLIKNPRTLFFNQGEDWTIYKNLPYVSSTAIIVPLLSGSSLLGFIMLADKSNGHDFSADNQILLESIGQQAAAAIQKILDSDINAATKDIKKIYIDPFNHF